MIFYRKYFFNNIYSLPNLPKKFTKFHIHCTCIWKFPPQKCNVYIIFLLHIYQELYILLTKTHSLSKLTNLFFLIVSWTCITPILLNIVLHFFCFFGKHWKKLKCTHSNCINKYKFLVLTSQILETSAVVPPPLSVNDFPSSFFFTYVWFTLGLRNFLII